MDVRWLQPPGLAAPGLGHHKTFAADELYALGRRLEGASSMLAERRIALERAALPLEFRDRDSAVEFRDSWLVFDGSMNFVTDGRSNTSRT